MTRLARGTQHRHIAAARREPIGERIRRIREERGLSQRALTGPGVSAAYISRIESGQRIPSGRALHVIAEKLGVPTEMLTGRGDGDERRNVELADAELELRFADNAAAAARKFSRLLRQAREAGDVRQAQRARAGLGLALVQQGQYEKALRLLAEVVADGSVSPARDPDVFAALARAYRALGSGSRAVELLRRCVAEVEASEGSSATYLRLATYLSSALAHLGDARAAKTVLDEALSRSAGSTDPRERVRALWSHARLATKEGDVGAAHSYIQRAIAILAEYEDTVHLARAQMLSAETLVASGEWDEAERRLDAADSLLGRRPDEKFRAALAVLRSETLNARGEFADAERYAREALELADDDPELGGRAQTQLGRSLSGQGERIGAHAAFSNAEELLEAAEPQYRQALFNSWADLLESEGRLSEALGMLRRASRDRPSATPAAIRSRPGRRKTRVTR